VYGGYTGCRDVEILDRIGVSSVSPSTSIDVEGSAFRKTQLDASVDGGAPAR
jgi:hypothetical protein